jgi:hypothetical protein
MAFDFKHLNGGADFEIEYYRDGLVVYRRNSLPAALEVMSELRTSLLLAGLRVIFSRSGEKDFLRVEKGAVDMNSLAIDIASQLEEQELAGSQRFAVVNRYKEPKA